MPITTTVNFDKSWIKSSRRISHFYIYEMYLTCTLHRIVYPINYFGFFKIFDLEPSDQIFVSKISMLIFCKGTKNEVYFFKSKEIIITNEMNLILGSVIVIRVKYRNRCPYRGMFPVLFDDWSSADSNFTIW